MVVTSTLSFLLDIFEGVLRGLVVKYLTRNSRSLVLAVLDHVGFQGSVLGQDTSGPQPSTGETQERHE